MPRNRRWACRSRRAADELRRRRCGRWRRPWLRSGRSNPPRYRAARRLRPAAVFPGAEQVAQRQRRRAGCSASAGTITVGAKAWLIRCSAKNANSAAGSGRTSSGTRWRQAPAHRVDQISHWQTSKPTPAIRVVRLRWSISKRRLCQSTRLLRERLSITTPLGSPVVPEVKITYSASLPSSAGLGAAPAALVASTCAMTSTGCPGRSSAWVARATGPGTGGGFPACACRVADGPPVRRPLRTWRPPGWR